MSAFPSRHRRRRVEPARIAADEGESEVQDEQLRPRVAAAEPSPSVSFNTNGGVITASALTATGIIFDTRVPTTQPATLLTATIPPLRTAASVPLATSSTSSSPSAAASSSPSIASTSNNHLGLAGIIAAFVALALALGFVVIIVIRRGRRKRAAEELARKSFAAGGAGSGIIGMTERSRGGMGATPEPSSVTRKGSKRRTWGELSGRDDIDVAQYASAGRADSQEALAFPMPPASPGAATTASAYSRDDRSRSSGEANSANDPGFLPPVPRSPFGDTLSGTSFLPGGTSTTASPSSSMIALQSQIRTVSAPRRINIIRNDSGGRVTSQDPSSFLSFSPTAASFHALAQQHEPSPSPPSTPLALHAASAFATGSAGGGATSKKAVRTNNIRALDNLIAALDETSTTGTGGNSMVLPEPSVWRAALGGDPGGHARSGSGLAH